MTLCGLPAAGGPCKRIPGHGGICHSGIAPVLPLIAPPPVNEPRIVSTVAEIISDLATDYFGTRGFRRMKRDLIFLIGSFVFFAATQFAFDLYILFR